MPKIKSRGLAPFLNQVRDLVNRQQHVEARARLYSAVAAHPDHPGILLWLGIVEQIAGNFPAALEHLQRANRLRGQNADCLFQLGQLMKRLSRDEEAIGYFRKALACRNEMPAARPLLASLLVGRQDFEGAIDILLEELRIRPGNSQAHTGLAQIYERMNRLEQAAASARSALQSQPGDARARLVLAHIERRREHYPEAEALYRSLLDTTGIDTGLARAHLAHVLDRQGRYDEAFEQSGIAMAGWKSLAAKRNLHPQTYLTLLDDCSDWLRNHSRESWPDPEHSGDSTASPVFFVGFPRSGTSLVERVLAQHPDLVGTGEAPVLETLLEKIPAKNGRTARFPASLDGLDDSDLAALREAYHAQVEKHGMTLGEGQRLVDKLPLNIALLPLVARIFPGAPVLVALRDPRDVCLSCFMQSFTLNTAMVCFLDLETTARTYASVMDLWLSYRKDLGLRYFEYRYEDLVEDFPGVTRKIFDFLQLEYPETASDYHRGVQGATLLTPSYQDVSRPVYTRASERWRNYRDHLEPLAETLAPYIEAFGYSRD